ncbi:MAG: IS5 family transposase [Planctomycetota bacterium]|nr:IS5 family transposase [Planctomycetota bacterium]
MERKTQAPMLMDAVIHDLGDPKMMAKLGQLDRAVPWAKLAAPIQATYGNTSDAGGRPNVPVEMMLKVMMLQKWFNLSDTTAEGMLRDRISFRGFVGIGLGDEVIDETSLVRFRGRLRQHGLTAALFDAVATHLKEAGLIVNEGTLVDATIIEAPRGQTRDDGVTHTKDPGATFTKKNGRTYHGYKAHIATDGNGMITDYRFDTAAPHDSKHADDLMAAEPNDGSVFADSAYMDAKRKAALEQRGIFCGIIQRRVRGQADLTKEQKAHNQLCSKFRAFVEHPFAWMKRSGSLRRTRYRGLARNALDFVLTAITYNFRRTFSLSA